MDDLRSIGGWLLAALCLPTTAVLFYYQQHEPSRYEIAITPYSAELPAFVDPGWFDAVKPNRSASAHLRGVNLVALMPYVVADGKWVSERDVVAKAESKLRQAGIAVAKPGPGDGRPPDATLYIVVSFADVAECGAISAFTVRTKLWRDAVTSSGDRLTKAVASVWSCEMHRCVGKQRRAEQWQAALEEQIGQLAGALTASNGR